MKFQKELLILPIVLLFIYFRPTFLVNFSSTFLGKLIMLGLIVLATLKNKWYGVSAAVLMIIITELGVIEGMDNDVDATPDINDLENGIAAIITDEGGVPGADAEADADAVAVPGADAEAVAVPDAEAVVVPGADADAVAVPGADADASNDEDEPLQPFTLMNNFGVTGGNERLYIDEKLRAKSSNDCLY